MSYSGRAKIDETLTTALVSLRPYRIPANAAKTRGRAVTRF